MKCGVSTVERQRAKCKASCVRHLCGGLDGTAPLVHGNLVWGVPTSLEFKSGYMSVEGRGFQSISKEI